MYVSIPYGNSQLFSNEGTRRFSPLIMSTDSVCSTTIYKIVMLHDLLCNRHSSTFSDFVSSISLSSGELCSVLLLLQYSSYKMCTCKSFASIKRLLTFVIKPHNSISCSATNNSDCLTLTDFVLLLIKHWK